MRTAAPPTAASTAWLKLPRAARAPGERLERPEDEHEAGPRRSGPHRLLEERGHGGARQNGRDQKQRRYE